MSGGRQSNGSKSSANRRRELLEKRRATSLHMTTADNLPGVETVASVAHATADKIEATADYMRNNDPQRHGAGRGGLRSPLSGSNDRGRCCGRLFSRARPAERLSK